MEGLAALLVDPPQTIVLTAGACRRLTGRGFRDFCRRRRRIRPNTEIRGYFGSRRGFRRLNRKDLKDLEDFTAGTKM